MTTEPTDAKPPEPQVVGGTFSKPVLVAGLLGGLLGAVLSFALGRALPAPVKPSPPAPATEAREFADFVVGKLQTEKYDEIAGIPLAVAEAPEQWRERVKEPVAASRKYCTERFGKSTGELELIRETPLGPTMTRLVYLEKFPRGGVVWAVGAFRGPDGWCLISVTVEPLDTAYPALR